MEDTIDDQALKMTISIQKVWNLILKLQSLSLIRVPLREIKEELPSYLPRGEIESSSTQFSPSFLSIEEFWQDDKYESPENSLPQTNSSSLKSLN